jgi:hypothetical protein
MDRLALLANGGVAENVNNPAGANLAAIALAQEGLGENLNQIERPRKRGPGRPPKRKGSETYHHDSQSYGIDRLQGMHIPIHLSRSSKKGKAEEEADVGAGKVKETRRRCIICKARVQFFCAQCNTAICFANSLENGGKSSCWYVHHHTV